MCCFQTVPRTVQSSNSFSRKGIRARLFWNWPCSNIPEEKPKNLMVAYLMLSIVALLAFLCVSHAIPGMINRNYVQQPPRRNQEQPKPGS